MSLDRRLHAFRGDLADKHLEGQVDAERFVDGTDHYVCAANTPIHRQADRHSTMESQALMGERFRVFDPPEALSGAAEGGWAWGQLLSDSYVGYVPSADLVPLERAIVPTHKLVVPRSFVYPAAELRDPPIETLSMGASFAVKGAAETRGTAYALVQLPDGRKGAVIARHIAPVETYPSDWVSLAETFLHSPYLWGGRTSVGLDCSALVQIPRLVCGLPTLRDSDMQAVNGAKLALNKDFSGLQRGDLIFWPGHVGIMLDEVRLLHSNGHHMATAIEPLAEAEARIAAHYGRISHARRPDPA